MLHGRMRASIAVSSIVLQIVCYQSGATRVASIPTTPDNSSEDRKRSKEDIFFVYGAAAGTAGTLSLGGIVWLLRREIKRIRSRRKLSSEVKTAEAKCQLPSVKELRRTEQRRFQTSHVSHDDDLLGMTPAALNNRLSLTCVPNNNNHYVSCYDLPAMRASALHPWPWLASGPFCGRPGDRGDRENSSHGSYERFRDTDPEAPVYGNV